jgi:SAM-dependent methyltransferase
VITRDFAYRGAELDTFAQAKRWKKYWSNHVRQHLGQCALEVGAGIGANTPYLNKGASEWICLEPDKNMAEILEQRRRSQELVATAIFAGTVSDLPRTRSFDSIVYIDVLEHIEDDAGEVLEAAARLRPGGTLIVLVPAHVWLFSPFDAAIGHYRRYSSKSLRRLACPELELVKFRQLDSVGIFASLANRFVFKSEIPTIEQVMIWDRFLVPMSRFFDPLLFYRIGKSLLAVWRHR